MFKVNESCKLSTVGIQFVVPKSFYIDIENMEAVNENEIRLVPAEKDCYINFRAFDDEYDSTMDSLLDTFRILFLSQAPLWNYMMMRTIMNITG